ncbi:MAG: Trm112 family protein [Desulfobulbaceae bacterium]
MIKKELLDILACPKCKQPVRLTADERGLACDRCRLLYEIRDDIPIMLIDEARPLEEEPANNDS